LIGERGSTGRRLDLCAVLILSFCLLVAVILWLDNVENITSNGAFKSLAVRKWTTDPSHAVLDPPNYLYFPFMAVLCRLLDLVGVFPGDPRHQLAVINAFFAALSLCVVYLLVREVTGRRGVAWAAVFFHLAGGFFLNLAIGNEDIMPSYAFLLASMALACVWFAEPTRIRVAIVSALFTLAWLMEWRLMFPTLPAMLLALAIGPGRVSERLERILLFLVVMVGLAQFFMALWGYKANNPPSVWGLIWTGKGVSTGYGGFSDVKFGFLWAGMAEYLAGGRNVGDLAAVPQFRTELWVGTAFVALIGVLSFGLLWRDRGASRIRVLAAIFGGTFVAGEVMNLYSQPQDPQMQINVMAWLTVGWALIVAAASRAKAVPVLGAAIAFAIGLFFYNVWQVAPARGLGAQWQAALEQIERNTDADRTVFLVHGFESFVSETFYAWNGDWNAVKNLGPAPDSGSRFRILALASGHVAKPAAPAAELADDLRSQIDHVMDLGYEVVVNDVWAMSVEQLTSSMATVAGPERAASVHRMLHESFDAVPAFSAGTAGNFFKLRRR